MRLDAALVGGVAYLMLCSSVPASAEGLDEIARATIRACGSNQVLGTAFLHERASDEGVKVVDVAIHVGARNNRLSEGQHAVHIHEVGNCASACAAAGGHFDPGPNGNSSPDGNHPFHLGDLVNIEIAGSGRGFLHTTTSRVTLSPGLLSVFDRNGSAFIIHTGADTYCPDGPAAGCAGGARAACGIIGRVR